MHISHDAFALRRCRAGDLSSVSNSLGGQVSTLGQSCSVCGIKVKAYEPAVMAQDALGWQIAHPACVGAESMPAVIHEPVEIDYSKGNAPYRTALIAAIQDLDKAVGVKGHGLVSVARQLVQSALDGNGFACKEIADRLDCKPQQSVDIRSLNVNASARDLTEAELDEILARAKPKRKARQSLDTNSNAAVVIDDKS